MEWTVVISGASLRETRLDPRPCPVCGCEAFDLPTDSPQARTLRRLAWAASASGTAFTVTLRAVNGEPTVVGVALAVR